MCSIFLYYGTVVSGAGPTQLSRRASFCRALLKSDQMQPAVTFGCCKSLHCTTVPYWYILYILFLRTRGPWALNCRMLLKCLMWWSKGLLLLLKIAPFRFIRRRSTCCSTVILYFRRMYSKSRACVCSYTALPTKRSVWSNTIHRSMRTNHFPFA